MYQKDKPAYNRIVEFFGEKILDDGRNIDRYRLGQIVFSDQDLLLKLESFILPELKDQKNQIINQHAKENHKIIIIESATILKNKEEGDYDEIWSCISSRNVLIKRMINNRKKSKLEAIRILKLNKPIKYFIEHSEVLFYTGNEQSDTLKQVNNVIEELILDLSHL